MKTKKVKDLPIILCDFPDDLADALEKKIKKELAPDKPKKKRGKK